MKQLVQPRRTGCNMDDVFAIAYTSEKKEKF